MKHLCKRMFAILMTVAVILTLFAGTFSASAASTYNNGKRDVLCTSLSSQAKAYYTGSYTYDKLSELSSTSLRTTLRSLVNSDRDTVGYNGLKTYFKYTDAYQGSSSRLMLFYCSGTTTSSWDGADTWNREHMWPDSLGGSAMEGDLHAMRPTDPNINSSRGNYRYGEVTGGSAAKANSANGNLIGGYYANSIFEPLDNAKGDCARVVLYDYVVSSSMNSVLTVFTSVDVLLDWCELDPVDTYEMSRNDVAEDIQGCRNPFVDYPELAWILMGKEIPAGMSTPSGEAGSAFTITAVSNNTAYGTVSLSGKTITATPKTGYKVGGYEVSPTGAATVSQSGNTFTVSNVTADCTITINFVAKDAATIVYHVPEGVTVSGTTSSYVGDSITLATISGSPTDQSRTYSFVGWGVNEIELTTTKPSVKAAGSSYTITAAETVFYGVFSYVQDGTTYYLTNTCTHESTHDVTTEPTCDKAGKIETICDNCGAIIATQSIAKLGHEYEMTTIAPTCTDKGYDLYSCTRCDDEYKKNYTDALDHIDEDSDNACDRCGTEMEGGTTPPVPPVEDCPCEQFTDVSESDWFHDPVVFAIENGLMNGVGNGQFAPNGSVTRGMLVTILYRAVDTPSIDGLENPFSDVEDGQWYTDAVIWAANNGIVNGMSATTYEPNTSITREQIAAILYRFAAKNGLDVEASGTLDFPDAGNVSAYAVDAITWATESGIINGLDGKLAPTDTATRAQLATMLMRFLTWCAEQSPIIY